MNRTPFIAWPEWRFLRFAWLLSVLNALWFTFIYGGSEWLTAQRSLRVPIHLPWELSIPIVRPLILAYMSIYLLFLGGPFIVRERREFIALICALALATGIGGIGFLLLPSRAAYAPATELGVWAGLFDFADRLNLDYNMVPSLHVALSVCCVAAYAPRASRFGAWLLWAWAAAIAFSTVLTHQHHIVDAVSGWFVGLIAFAVATRCAPSAATKIPSARAAGSATPGRRRREHPRASSSAVC